MVVGNDFLANLRKVQVVKKTITRSIRDLIADRRSGKITIPEYQRNFVWDNSKQCRFIESIFLQIPIPPIFMLEKLESGENQNTEVIFEVIDGVQRVTTIVNFVSGFLKLSGLETLPDLNQAKFSALPLNIRSLFEERQIDTIIIESGTNPEIQFEVFGRLNQGSVSLNAQELRNCTFHGEFNNFLVNCSRNTTYRKLLEPFGKFDSPKEGKPDKSRMFDVELILRFFALYELFDSDLNRYPESRGETLNGYMRKRNSNSDDLKSMEDLEIMFEKVIEMVAIVFNGNHFRSFSRKKGGISSSTLNQSIFDIQMLSLADYEINQVSDKSEIIYETFLDISSYDIDFIDATSKATNSKVNSRVISWKNRLKDVIENPQKYISKLSSKRELFNVSPFCTETGERIDSLDQADVMEGKLYHRNNLSENDIIKSGKKKTRSSKKTPVSFRLNGSNYQADDLNDAIQQILDIVQENIQNSNFDIDRLHTLNFIGTHEELRKKSTKRDKNFKSTKIDKPGCGTLLYFDASEGRNEILMQIREMAKLFAFMKDFSIQD